MITGSPNNLIGGTAPSERNVISANAGGIQISSPGSTGNQVVGNFIGTNASGTAALGNDFWGVVISDAPGNIVGGLTPGSGNVISANGSHGIQLSGASATGNQIVGNRIGTDLSGTILLGNALAGIFLSDAPNNTIGGTGSSAGNVISGNGQYGILIQGTASTGNGILGNRIGTTSDGTSALANGHGVVVFSSSSNIVGGTTAAARNVISGNSGLGVWLDSLTTGNLVQGNSSAPMPRAPPRWAMRSTVLS
jgi:titin